LPAWWTWSIFSTQWYFSQRHGVEAALVADLGERSA
jgi:hypothetical protein